MNEEPHQFEERLARLSVGGVPSGLRSAVLGDVRRELAAARWDRRLARFSASIVALGVGLNVVLASWPRSVELSGRPRLAASAPANRSLINAALAVAEATDVETSTRVIRQLSEFGGHTLTGDESAAINAALHRQDISSSLVHDKDG